MDFIPPIPILLLILLVVIWAIWTVNSFRKKEIKASESRSGVEAALTKRYDVLSKMLDASKGYLAHEQEVFLHIVQVRKDMTTAEISQTENNMDLVSEQILAAAEEYPALKSSDAFRELQIGIEDTERHLEAARRVYNSNVREYNTAIARFPACLLAFRRRPMDFFQSKSGVHRDLTITF